MRTSVNLRLIDLPKMSGVCEKTGLSQSVLIRRCLMKLFASYSERLMVSLISKLVEYQPKGMGYRIVNVDLDVDTYNLGINFRVFCRISVSKMVTMALDLFLNDVVDETEGKKKVVHNYVWYYHNLETEYSIFAPEWTVKWRVNKKKPKTRHDG